MTPLLIDINGPEFILLLVIAIVLFGPEKLPEFARKAARVVSYLRNIAGNAQSQLSKELGPEFENFDVRDLNPKSFIQRHLLDDVAPVVDDVKKDLVEVGSAGKSAAGDVKNAVDTGGKSVSAGGPAEVAAATAPDRDLTPYDPDAT